MKTPDQNADLRAHNADLLRRVEQAEATIERLRQEAVERRAEVRAMAESLPTAMSRNTLVKSMLSDVKHHPDKAGVSKRAVLKLGRAPRKAMRIMFKKF